MMALVKEGETPVPEGEQPFKFVNAEYLLRSLTCSLQLFAGSIDSNVVDGIKDHQYLKGAISQKKKSIEERMMNSSLISNP
jgi:hypothetical protein